MDPVTLGMAKAAAATREATELGRLIYNPTLADTKTGASPTGDHLSNGRQDLPLDFIAPSTGIVDVMFSAYVLKPAINTSDASTGMCIMLGDVPVPGSLQLLNHNDPAVPTKFEGRFTYHHRLTGLTPGASYTIFPGIYVPGNTSGVRIACGNVYGPFLGVVRAATATPAPLGHTYAAGTSTVILTDTYFNAWPGVCRAANGDLVIGFSKSTAIASGGQGLWVKRSTDNGATWGAPIEVANDPTKLYGPGAVSTHPDGSITLVSLTAPTAGGANTSGPIIYTSVDDGLTWGAPQTVTIPAGWDLGKYKVADCPLLDVAGVWHLGVWGEATGAPTGSYESGILRSTDQGATWTRVALFKNLPSAKFNESNVTFFEGKYQCVIRDEVLSGYWLSTSLDGITWTAPAPIRGQSTGSPKLTVIGDVCYWVSRYGPDGTGWGHVIGLKNGKAWRVAPLMSASTLLYGQAVDLGSGQIGVVHSAGVSPSVADLKWSVITVS